MWVAASLWLRRRRPLHRARSRPGLRTVCGHWPTDQFVGQIISHLRREMRPYTRGGDLEDTVMLDQSYLPTHVIAHLI